MSRIAITTLICASLGGCATLVQTGAGEPSAGAAGSVRAPFQAPFTYDRWPAAVDPAAITAAKEKAEAEPENARAQLALCDAQASHLTWIEAAKSCSIAAELAPTVVGSHQRLVSIYWNMRAYDKARDAAAVAASLTPGDAPTRYWLGVGHAKLGQDTDAARELDEAIRLAPDRSDFYRQAVRAHQRLNSLGRAAELARTAAQLAPGDDQLVRLPTEVRKVIDQRLFAFQAVLLKEPSNPAAYAYLAGGMARYGMHDDAIEQFDEALDRMPNASESTEAFEQLRAEIRYNRGASLLAKKRYDEAASDFVTAKTLRPALAPQADFMTGLVRLDQGQPVEAIAALEASVAAASEVADNRAALIRAYRGAQRNEDADAAQLELDALQAPAEQAAQATQATQ